MQDNKTSLFQFLNRVIIAFAVIVFVLMIAGPLVGNDAKNISNLFSLGNVGISYITLLQALIISFISNLLSVVFTSDMIFKKLLLMWRTVIMFFCVGAIVGVLCILFGWLPTDKPIAWFSYLLCFILCAVLSTFIVLKKRREDISINRKLEEYKKSCAANERTKE